MVKGKMQITLEVDINYPVGSYNWDLVAKGIAKEIAKGNIEKKGYVVDYKNIQFVKGDLTE